MQGYTATDSALVTERNAIQSIDQTDSMRLNNKNSTKHNAVVSSGSNSSVNNNNNNTGSVNNNTGK